MEKGRVIYGILRLVRTTEDKKLYDGADLDSFHLTIQNYVMDHPLILAYKWKENITIQRDNDGHILPA